MLIADKEGSLLGGKSFVDPRSNWLKWIINFSHDRQPFVFNMVKYPDFLAKIKWPMWDSSSYAILITSFRQVNRVLEINEGQIQPSIHRRRGRGVASLKKDFHLFSIKNIDVLKKIYLFTGKSWAAWPSSLFNLHLSRASIANATFVTCNYTTISRYIAHWDIKQFLCLTKNKFYLNFTSGASLYICVNYNKRNSLLWILF